MKIEMHWQTFAPDPGDHGVFEPSGICQLDDGRFLAVQDEVHTPFSLLGWSPADGFRVEALAVPDTEPLNDLEGLARSADGTLYAISSHSRTLAGKRDKHREKVVRFRIDGGRVCDFAVCGDLRKAITGQFPLLKPFAKAPFPKGRKGFNIEGLCFDAEGQALLIGLRGPIVNGKTLVLVLENPAVLFQEDEEIRFRPDLVRLDMNEQGIRAMTHVPALSGYLLVGQRARKMAQSGKPFHLWFWSGERGDQPRRIAAEGLDMRRTEGIAPAQLDGRDVLVFVSDDGNRKSGRTARYGILEMDEARRLVDAAKG